MISESLPKSEIIQETQSLWGTNRRPAGCPVCQRVYLVLPDQMGINCPLCRMAELAPQPARLRPAEPEKMMPFKINRNQLQPIYREFVSGLWIKPDDLTAENLASRAHPVFWPLWLVDSDVAGRWQMEAGFDYQVESTKEIFVNGRWESQKQIETRIRWEPRLGQLNTHVDNVSAPALEEHQNRLSMTGNYPLKQAVDFKPDLLEDAILEVPDLPPEDAWPMAKPQVEKILNQLCQDACGAQHQRNFAVKALYNNLNWTELLLPLYATYYLDDEGEPQIIIINGVTGAIQGPLIASRKKGLRIAGILAGAAGIMFLLALLSLLLAMVIPEIKWIGALLILLGLGTGFSAIVPAMWPGQWNRKQVGPRIPKP